jgi:hypothetical protein
MVESAAWHACEHLPIHLPLVQTQQNGPVLPEIYSKILYMRKAIGKSYTEGEKKNCKPKNNTSFISILHQTFIDKISEKSNIWGIDKEDEEQSQTSILTLPIHHIILGKSCEPI